MAGLLLAWVKAPDPSPLDHTLKGLLTPQCHLALRPVPLGCDKNDKPGKQSREEACERQHYLRAILTHLSAWSLLFPPSSGAADDIGFRALSLQSSLPTADSKGSICQGAPSGRARTRVLGMKLSNMVVYVSRQSQPERHRMQPCFGFINASFLISEPQFPQLQQSRNSAAVRFFYEETIKSTRGMMSASNQKLVKMCQTLTILELSTAHTQHLNTHTFTYVTRFWRYQQHK